MREFVAKKVIMKKFLSVILSCIITISLFPAVASAANKPSAPSVTSASAKSSSSIEVKWGKVSGATSYRVDIRKSGDENYKTLTSGTSSTSYTASGLTSGSTYYFRVYAKNSAGTSERSATYMTHTKPAAPGQPSVSRDSESQLTISWNKVSGATKYKLLYRKADGSNNSYVTLASNLTATSYTHKKLSAGTKYCYRVVAVRTGEVGPEGRSSIKNVESDQSATKSKFTKLARPSNGVNNDKPNEVILSWKAASGDSTYKYQVYRDGKLIATTSALTYTDSSAVSGTIYPYYIRVVDTKDNNNSVSSCDIFYAGPKITKGISLTPQSASSMKISWDKPSSKTGLVYSVKKMVNGEYTTVATTKNNYYVDSGLKTGQTYQYYIQVRDTADNYLTSTYSKSAVLQILPEIVSLSKRSAEISPREHLKLTAIITPSNCTDKTVSWESSNDNIVSVTDGTVTAKAEGVAVITARTSNGKKIRAQ